MQKPISQRQWISLKPWMKIPAEDAGYTNWIFVQISALFIMMFTLGYGDIVNKQCVSPWAAKAFRLLLGYSLPRRTQGAASFVWMSLRLCSQTDWIQRRQCQVRGCFYRACYCSQWTWKDFFFPKFSENKRCSDTVLHTNAHITLANMNIHVWLLVYLCLFLKGYKTIDIHLQHAMTSADILFEHFTL